MKDILTMQREGLRFEAKLAAGGLPKSLWETYCSFANTDGGVIVLGAAEREDGSLDVVGVKDPERPIFLNRDMLGNTFRRNGEGDYRCSESEVLAMVRDADNKSQDLKLLPWATVADLNLETVHRYRNRMQTCRPGHVWLDLDDEAFLRRIGALAFDENGTLRVTCAGMLMFGNEYDIVREFPKYFLDYQERFSSDVRWSDRVISSSGEWSGNVYDFYFRVYNKIAQTLKVPFKLVGQDRVDDTPVHQAIREVLVNCVVNADYRLPQGVVIVRDAASLTLSNPGSFRVPIETARSGGVSDPRNETMLKMFTLIDIGERAGSGIPSVEATWDKMKLKKIGIAEMAEPARVKVELELLSAESVNGAKAGQKVGQSEKPEGQKVGQSDSCLQTDLTASAQQVLASIREDASFTSRGLAAKLGFAETTIDKALAALTARGLIRHVGPRKGGRWEVLA